MRADVKYLLGTFQTKERYACELLGLAVSTYRYASRRPGDEPFRAKLFSLARDKPRFGYHRLPVLLERDGENVNHKNLRG